MLLACAGAALSLCTGHQRIALQPNRRSFTPVDEPPVVVDLRPRADFRECHLVGAASVPVAELAAQLYTLPPPAEWPVVLLGSREQIAEAQALLRPKGWTAAELSATTAHEVESLGSTVRGDDDSAPTWRPNSFLSAVLRSQQITTPEGVVVDVGCGSGRDAVYLRQHLQAPEWDVVGVDNHAAALERGRTLARSCGRADVRFVQANVRKQRLDECVAAGARPVSLVHGCRFLDLAMLETLPELLAPGGVLVWSTFLEGCELIAPPFRPSRRLEFGQMRRLCGEESGFTVVCDEQGELITRGKWVPAQFYAAVKQKE